VRKAGNRVRVTAQLIDASDGHHVWAERFDRELEDIFALQDEITEAIMQALNPELFRVETARAARLRPESLGAYDCYMRGVWHFNNHTREDSAEARQLLARAIELDPHVTYVHELLAMVHYLDVINQWTDSPAESVAEVIRCAEKGVVLEPGSPLAQMAVGAACSLTQQRDKMIEALERAIEINPSLAPAHSMLGAYLAFAGRSEDAIAHLEQAIQLSPKDPFNWLTFYGMAMARFAAGKYEDAVEWAQKSVQGRADFPIGYRCLAASYACLGREDEARTALKEALRLQPEFSIGHVRLTLSSADPAFLDRFIDGLRKAGMKE
jgi:adenylate cyclase